MNQIWKTIIVAAISAFFAFLGSYYIYSDQLKISKLDIHKSFEPNYFSKPKFPTEKIILKVNKVDKEKLGLFQVSLVNYTAKDFLDIPLKIKITPNKVSEFKILAYSAVGQDEVYDLITKTKEMSFDGASYNFSYEVSSLNRTDKPKAGFQLRILFEGSEEPKVSIVPKGVGTRDYDENNNPVKKSTDLKAAAIGIGIAILFLFLIFVLSLLVFGPLISVFTIKSDIKYRKQYAMDLFETIKEDNLLPSRSDEYIANFVADMLYSKRCKWWRKKSPIGRWSLGLFAPERSDYLIDV